MRQAGSKGAAAMGRQGRKILHRFLGDERGFVTYFALVVMMLILLFSGISVDSTNAWRNKLELQTAADAAALAGAMVLPDKADALSAALELAKDNLGGTSSSDAITASSVQFGSWDKSTRKFGLNETPTDAIRVIATRSTKNRNPVPTFFLRLAGFKSWNIQVESIANRSTSTCKVADIATDGTFKITSNNNFYNGFCVEAAGGVKLNNNNRFDNDNRIYVKSLSDINLPGSQSLSSVVGRGTKTSSAGLTYRDIFAVKSKISAPYVSNINALANKYLDPYYSGQPSYINPSAAVIKVQARDVKYTTFKPRRIYKVICGGSNGSKAQFYKGVDIEDVVIVSACRISLGTQSKLQNVVLVSRNTGSHSVYAASKVQLGKNDKCAAGGGVKIYTAGGFKSAWGLRVYGGFISAKGNVKIAAKSDGIAGISIHAGGNVSFSARAQFGTCKNSASNSSDVAYLLVE